MRIRSFQAVSDERPLQQTPGGCVDLSAGPSARSRSCSRAHHVSKSHRNPGSIGCIGSSSLPPADQFGGRLLFSFFCRSHLSRFVMLAAASSIFRTHHNAHQGQIQIYNPIRKSVVRFPGDNKVAPGSWSLAPVPPHFFFNAAPPPDVVPPPPEFQLSRGAPGAGCNFQVPDNIPANLLITQGPRVFAGKTGSNN